MTYIPTFSEITAEPVFWMTQNGPKASLRRAARKCAERKYGGAKITSYDGNDVAARFTIEGEPTEAVFIVYRAPNDPATYLVYRDLLAPSEEESSAAWAVAVGAPADELEALRAGRHAAEAAMLAPAPQEPTAVAQNEETMKTLYTAHLAYTMAYDQPGAGKLNRALAYRGQPARFVRWLTVDERRATGKGVMIEDAAGFKWELHSREVEVTDACPCGCGN